MSNTPSNRPHKPYKVSYNISTLPLLYATQDSEYLKIRNHHYLTTPHAPYPVHWHYDFEFCRVIEGSIAYIIDDKKVTLSEGQGIFITPGLLHAIMSDDHNYGKYQILIFPISLLAQVTDKFTIYLTQRFPISSSNYIILNSDISWNKAILDKIAAMSQITDTYPSNPVRILSKAFEICADICDHIEPAEINPKENQMEELFLKMTDFISNYYWDNITVDDIAQAGHVSLTKCNQLFQKFAHKTPNAYLMHVRATMSALMLRYTDCSLADIADRCGFNTSNYWFPIFRREFGTTPKQYRENFINRKSE